MKLETFVKWFIGVMFVLAFLVFIGQVALAFFIGDAVIDAIQNGDGIKGVVEGIWFGKGGQ